MPYRVLQHIFFCFGKADKKITCCFFYTHNAYTKMNLSNETSWLKHEFEHVAIEKCYVHYGKISALKLSIFGPVLKISYAYKKNMYDISRMYFHFLQVLIFLAVKVVKRKEWPKFVPDGHVPYSHCFHLEIVHL